MSERDHDQDQAPSRAPSLTRRGLLRGLGRCVLTLPLVASLKGRRAFAASPLSVAELLRELNDASRSLCQAQIDGPDWQLCVQALLARVDPTLLRDAIEIDWRALASDTRSKGRAELRLAAADLPAGPSEPAFRSKLFAMQRGHAIVPHGHRNLVSAFLVLDGRLRGRHFDRLRDDPEAILIRPTDDRSFTPGDCAAISDHVDNVHWFTALEDQALLFNVSVTIPERLRLRQTTHSTGRVYLDPEGELLDHGVIRAPRATLAALRAKYDGSGR